MGNENFVKLVGVKTVKVDFTSGKELILINVHYVPRTEKTKCVNLLYKKGIKSC